MTHTHNQKYTITAVRSTISSVPSRGFHHENGVNVTHGCRDCRELQYQFKFPSKEMINNNIHLPTTCGMVLIDANNTIMLRYTLLNQKTSGVVMTCILYQPGKIYVIKADRMHILNLVYKQYRPHNYSSKKVECALCNVCISVISVISVIKVGISLSHIAH